MFRTTAHSDADVERIISAFDESVAEMQKAGFFPMPPASAKVTARTHNPVLRRLPSPLDRHL